MFFTRFPCMGPILDVWKLRRKKNITPRQVRRSSKNGCFFPMIKVRFFNPTNPIGSLRFQSKTFCSGKKLLVS